MGLIRKLAEQKAVKIASHCSQYVEHSLLDIGAGRGLIAKELAQSTSKPVTCVDVKDLNESEMPYTVYSGNVLPFEDESYGTCLLTYVLHHCESPEQVLKEAIRVSSKRIIIFEDVPSFMTKALDVIANKLHGVATPLNFKTPYEWENLFDSVGLTVVRKELGVEKEWFYPGVEHVMFVLDKVVKR